MLETIKRLTRPARIKLAEERQRQENVGREGKRWRARKRGRLRLVSWLASPIGPAPSPVLRRCDIGAPAGIFLRGLSVGVIAIARRRSVYPLLTPAAKISALRRYARDFGLSVFVETGTHKGMTVAALAPGFRECFTIELSDSFYADALGRLRGVPNVACLQGDSGLVLPGLLESAIRQPALFWLDAHASGDGTAKGADPIFRELHAIYAHAVKDHVILVDDARGHDIDRIVGGVPPTMRASVRNDIIRIVPIR